MGTPHKKFTAAKGVLQRQGHISFNREFSRWIGVRYGGYQRLRVRMTGVMHNLPGGTNFNDLSKLMVVLILNTYFFFISFPSFLSYCKFKVLDFRCDLRMNFYIPGFDSGKENIPFLSFQHFTRKHTNMLDLIPQQHE